MPNILYIVKASVKMAEWKEVQGYPQYLLSNEGQIKFNGDNDNPEIEWPIWKNGTTALRDRNNTLSKIMSIHRLVAEHFVECILADKPKDCYYVKHIDGDKTNNRADNLCWSNSPHGLSMKPKLPRKPMASITLCDDETRQSIRVYTRCNGAKRNTDFRYKNIGKGKAMDKANEYVRQFKEEHNIED